MGLFKKNRKKWSLGPIKNLEDITLEDMKNSPIWVNDLAGEWEDNFDESSERPILGTEDITSDIINEFASVSILVKVQDENTYGSANLGEDGSVCCLAVWQNNGWVIGNKAFQGKDHVEIEVIPSINGVKNIIYSYDLNLDIGRKK